MKIYISGAITGYSQYKIKFRKAKRELEAKGYSVINPAEFKLPEGATWEDYMKHDLADLLKCDAIYMLNNWRQSRGAMVEHNLAQLLRMQIQYEPLKEEAWKITSYSPEKLKIILEKHKHWLYEDCEGWENMRANLSYADLRGADLRGANLSDADLSYANLSDANLSDANLSYADLRGADLSDADLSYANLSDANLSDANLSYADLSYANLRGANLSDADLSYADLSDADLSDAKNMPYIPMVCPEEGKFIGWKKAEVQGEEENHYRKVIVKLEIPASAKRSSATSRKCRCNKAKVLEIYNLDGTVAKERKCYSSYNNDFIYEVGKTGEVDDFCEDRWNECAQGIHFFMNRQEAIDY